MSELTTYNGSCHCGNIRFKVSMPDLRSAKIARCNCSICTKNGYLLVYPKKENIVFEAGTEEMSEYRMGSKERPHKFCGRCGTSILIELLETDAPQTHKNVTAMNIRTLEGVEDILKDLQYQDIDGKRYW